MATSLSTTISLTVGATYLNPLAFNTVDGSLSYRQSMSWTDGVGTNQAQKVASIQQTIAPSGTFNLDFSGSLVDAFGVANALTRVKGVIIKSADTNTVNVVVGGTLTNQALLWFGAAAHTESLQPGQMIAKFTPQTGWAITAATADLLLFTNGAASSIVDIVVIGF